MGIIIPPLEMPKQQVLADSLHIAQYQGNTFPSQIEAINTFSLMNGRWQQKQITFQRHNPTANGIIRGFSFLSAQRGFVMIQVGQGGREFYHTIDGGKTWQKVGLLS
ncbi:hypothetical protein KSX_03820 [Ktedonospora formicarum]|uniref:Photosynthesis system II assembly factor Ycf48/Hcf136-like domain-containing protein n=1 Tax=Ktedonospora formicarum TaxID=2778364 RepID=A0A8J3HZN7_9CHLR|nr:hypothetical protein KSX_03820 [Ktedonospora formicarum]